MSTVKLTENQRRRARLASEEAIENWPSEGVKTGLEVGIYLGMIAGSYTLDEHEMTEYLRQVNEWRDHG